LEVVFWAFLDQVQTPMGSCREAVRKVMAFACRKHPHQRIAAMSPDSSAYCQARSKISLELMDEISTHLVERMQRNIPKDALWHARHVKLVDGTSVSMPDTPANQARWPQISNQKPGCGFPLMNVVAIFCLATGALIKAVHSDRRTHETTLFRKLWHVLEKGDLLLADRGFCSFANFANLLGRGIDVLMRLPERKLRVAIATQLPKRQCFDVIVNWKRPLQCLSSMNPQEFALLPANLRVRVIRYTIAQPGFRTRTVTLITTLLDPAIKAKEFAALYFRRWEIELHFREIKVLLHMDVLRCLSPAMIERELAMHLVAYNLIRCVMQNAALTYNADLSRLSFKGCLDTVRHFANAAHGAENSPKTIAAIVDEMLLAIARDPNPSRPDRSQPRAVKRRRKNYRLLTKPRHEMGNLPHRKIGVENLPKSPLT
jgi:hypothetical protein